MFISCIHDTLYMVNHLLRFEHEVSSPAAEQGTALLPCALTSSLQPLLALNQLSLLAWHVHGTCSAALLDILHYLSCGEQVPTLERPARPHLAAAPARAEPAEPAGLLGCGCVAAPQRRCGHAAHHLVRLLSVC